MPSTLLAAPLSSLDPAAYLPHRYPFLTLDRVVSLEPGVSACAITRVTADPAGFPHVMLVECIAQLGGIVAVQTKGEGGFLAGIEQAEFSGAVAAGDMLQVTARVVKAFGRLFLIEGEVECDGLCLVRARMSLGIGLLS